MKNTIDWQQQRKRSSDRYMALRDRDFKRRWGRSLGGDYFDPQGRRIDMWRWAKLSYNHVVDGRTGHRVISKWKRVAQTTTRSGAHWISTVWLGLDHSWGMGPPLIFESMVFCKHDDAEAKQRRNAERVMNVDPAKLAEFGEEYEDNDCPISNDMDRYATIRDARKGHNRMVEAVRRFEKERKSGSK